MSPGTSCCDCGWPGGVPAIRFGSELYYAGAETCRDCGTPVGGSHHYSCSLERCPHGNQAITCEVCPPLEHDPYEAAGRAN